MRSAMEADQTNRRGLIVVEVDVTGAMVPGLF